SNFNNPDVRLAGRERPWLRRLKNENRAGSSGGFPWACGQLNAMIFSPVPTHGGGAAHIEVRLASRAYFHLLEDGASLIERRELHPWQRRGGGSGGNAPT